MEDKETPDVPDAKAACPAREEANTFCQLALKRASETRDVCARWRQEISEQNFGTDRHSGGRAEQHGMGAYDKTGSRAPENELMSRTQNQTITWDQTRDPNFRSGLRSRFRIESVRPLGEQDGGYI